MNALQIMFPIISVVSLLMVIGISVIFVVFPYQTVEYMADYFERKNVYGLKPRHDIRGEWVAIYIRILGFLMLSLICCSLALPFYLLS